MSEQIAQTGFHQHPTQDQPIEQLLQLQRQQQQPIEQLQQLQRQQPPIEQIQRPQPIEQIQRQQQQQQPPIEQLQQLQQLQRQQQQQQPIEQLLQLQQTSSQQPQRQVHPQQIQIPQLPPQQHQQLQLQSQHPQYSQQHYQYDEQHDRSQYQAMPSKQHQEEQIQKAPIQRPIVQQQYHDERRQINHQQYHDDQRYPEEVRDRQQTKQHIPQTAYKHPKTFESQLIEAHLLKLKSKQMDTFLGFFLKKKTIDKYTSNFDKYNTSSADFLSDWQKCGKEKNIIILKLFLNINESNEWNMTLYDFIETYTAESRNMEKILHKCYNFCDVAWQSKKLDKLIEIMEE